MKRRRILLLSLSLLLTNLVLASNDYEKEITENKNLIKSEEETVVKPLNKLEKTEQDLEHMKERIDFYKRVVRSVEREEEELKALKKVRISDIKKPIN